MSGFVTNQKRPYLKLWVTTFAGKVDGDKIEGKAVAGKDTLNWLARKIP